jgi:SAM-dependent methyltransferase
MHAADKSEHDLACQTLLFYETNAQLYAEQTRGIDLAHLYQPFLSAVSRGGKILDIGCGAGRDLKRFVEDGFEAVGIDPSEKLAAIASKYSGCKVLISGVQDLKFIQEFDGAWACASLIHLPRNLLTGALERIFLALRPHGVLLISMQMGSGETVTDDGRFFTRYTSQELSDAIERSRFELINVWITPDSLPGRDSITWVNAIARKPFED